MSLTALAQCYTETQLFNTIGGQLSEVSPESVDLQLDLIFSELTETIDAFESQDDAGLLQEAVDTFVTVAGLLQKLEKAGFNVGEALTKVSANNLTKFVPLGQYTQYGEGVISEYNHKYEVTVLKNLAGKMVKPSYFEPVNLADCVPKKRFWGE